MKLNKFLIAFLLIASSAFTQNQTIFNYDYALFYTNDNNVVLDFYYSFYQSALTQKIDSVGQKISGVLDVSIYKSGTEDLVDNKKGSFTTIFDSSNISKALTGVLNFQLAPGSYKCSFIAKDGNKPERFVAADFELVVNELKRDELQFSDIQFATSIIPNSTNLNSMFYKNTLEVIPNPVAVISSNLPVLFYYCELYNALNNMASDKLNVTETITDAYGKEIYSKRKNVARSYSSIVLSDAVKLPNINSGAYIFSIIATDSVNMNATKQSKKFYFINLNNVVAANENSRVSDPNYISSEFLTMSDDEIDHLFEQSKYIMSEDEKQNWYKLTNYDAKRKYLFNVWQKQDTKPITAINEAKIEYLQRIEYANRNFNNIGQSKGWKTDRGRVYIVYGKPDEIERYPNVTDTKPYEIWHYNQIESGVIFVFADLSGYSDYRLIHSNKRGELANLDWRNIVGL